MIQEVVQDAAGRNDDSLVLSAVNNAAAMRCPRANRSGSPLQWQQTGEGFLTLAAVAGVGHFSAHSHKIPPFSVGDRGKIDTSVFFYG
jgi:hypothetical protein